MAKAEARGIYTIGGKRFIINKGDIIPDGAEYTADPEPASDEPAAAHGPSETTSTPAGKTGPKETT